MRKLFKERKQFKGGNYMRKYGILFWNMECGNYSKEETIQGRKLLFSYFLEAGII